MNAMAGRKVGFYISKMDKWILGIEAIVNKKTMLMLFVWYLENFYFVSFWKLVKKQLFVLFHGYKRFPKSKKE